MRQIEAALAQKGSYISKTAGDSMRPLFKEGRDLVYVESLAHYNKALRVGDVILFKREDQTYVLHRIVKISGTQILECGDNRRYATWLTPQQVLGVMTRFNRKNQEYSIDDWRYRWYRSYKIITLNLKLQLYTVARKLLNRK